MSDWQPIETAPKGRYVLAFWRQFNNYAVVARGEAWWYDEDDASYADPTHWMPLPDPPKEAA